MLSDKYLVWIDLEMTGLDSTTDVILEIASLITDNQLAIIAQGPHFVIHQPDALLTSMNEWCSKQHTASGLCDAVRASTTTIAEAEKATLNFIANYCKPQTALLAGNSIFQDRIFLAKFMPSIVDYLNYRLIDVSTVKELARRWYPGNQLTDFKKKDSHRAVDDILESVRELEHYRKNFFK